MATENNLSTISMVAASDMSTTGQYRFVVINSSGEAAIAGAAAEVDGVMQSNPGLGQSGSVGINGVTKIVLAATLAAGATVASDGSGEAVASSVNPVQGKLLEGGAAGDIVSMLLKTK